MAAYFVHSYFWGAGRRPGRHPIPVEQARALTNWVAASGKNLTTIYATHGHGDHFFGTSTVLERFPSARFVARPDVIKVMPLGQKTHSASKDSMVGNDLRMLGLSLESA